MMCALCHTVLLDCDWLIAQGFLKFRLILQRYQTVGVSFSRSLSQCVSVCVCLRERDRKRERENKSVVSFSLSEYCLLFQMELVRFTVRSFVIMLSSSDSKDQINRCNNPDWPSVVVIFPPVCSLRPSCVKGPSYRTQRHLSLSALTPPSSVHWAVVHWLQLEKVYPGT